MAISIYLDKEGEMVLEKIRKEDVDFNFSGWIKEQLIRYYKKDEIEDVVQLSELLEEAKIMQMKAETKQENIRRRLALVKLKQEEKQREHDDNLTEEQRNKKTRFNTFVTFAPQFIKVSKEDLELFAIQFQDLDCDLRTFLDLEGLVKNEEENRDPPKIETTAKNDPINVNNDMNKFIDKQKKKDKGGKD